MFRSSKPRSGAKYLAVGLALAGVLATADALAAHDFWLVPNAFQMGIGETLTVLGQTSSRFPTTESAVTIDRVADARVIGAMGATRISDLSIADKSLRLRARPSTPGQYIVAASLHWRSMRESAASFRRYLQLEGAPAALERIDREGLLTGRDSLTRRYAKYAKTVVQVGNGGGRAFSGVAGHPLEFMPEKDPADLRSGDTLPVRLLFQGRPLADARVHAGAVRWTASTTAPDTHEVAKDVELRSDANGVIRVPIMTDGLWNVRTIQIVQSPSGAGADWDAHWATLVFLVSSQGGNQSRDSLDVVSVVNAYDDALRTGDSTAALAFLSEDAIILESGGVETKQQYRSHHLTSDMAFAKAVPSQSSAVSVKVRGDVAWAWSTSTTQGSFRERQINSVGAELMVLTRTPTGWKISAIHWSSRTRRP